MNSKQHFPSYSTECVTRNSMTEKIKMITINKGKGEFLHVVLLLFNNIISSKSLLLLCFLATHSPWFKCLKRKW